MCSKTKLTLTFLMDTARRTEETPSYSFHIDYEKEKAYDKVDQFKLVELPDEKGCGSQFLAALQHLIIEGRCRGDPLFNVSSKVALLASSYALFTFFH